LSPDVPRRSYHFVPAHRREFFARALSSEADALVFDLEDGVPDNQKCAAVENLRELFSAQAPSAGFYVRLVAIEGELTVMQTELLKAFEWVKVVLPKIRSQEDARRFGVSWARVAVVLVEDFQGLQALPELVRGGHLEAVGLGLEDMLATIPHAAHDLGALRERCRTDIVLAARAAGIASIDTVHLDLGAGAEFVQDCREARSCGFSAKFTVHPRQVPVVNREFRPDAKAVQAAVALLRRIAGTGGTGYRRDQDGVLVSPLAIRKAQTIIKAAQESTG
jgi:citrate lyase beta subunit